MTTVATTPPTAADRFAIDRMLRDYHDARRREDQWRIPQLLLALVTPIVALIATVFAYAGQTDYATISGAIAIVTGTGAALVAVEVWRRHRAAIGIANSFRDKHPADRGLLLKDPL
jgi:uncharacterized membrane protein